MRFLFPEYGSLLPPSRTEACFGLRVSVPIDLQVVIYL